MPVENRDSLGLQFARRLNLACQALSRVLPPMLALLPTLVGLSPNGTAVVPIENIRRSNGHPCRLW